MEQHIIGQSVSEMRLQNSNDNSNKNVIHDAKNNVDETCNSFFNKANETNNTDNECKDSIFLTEKKGDINILKFLKENKYPNIIRYLFMVGIAYFVSKRKY